MKMKHMNDTYQYKGLKNQNSIAKSNIGVDFFGAALRSLH